MWYKLKEYVDEEYEIVASEVKVLKKIDFERYVSCYDCGVAQQIYMRWEEIYKGNQKFERIKEGVCQYEGIIWLIVIVIMIVGLLEVVDQEVWLYIRAEGIWGANEKLNTGKKVKVKKGMLKQFG